MYESILDERIYFSKWQLKSLGILQLFSKTFMRKPESRDGHFCMYVGNSFDPF